MSVADFDRFLGLIKIITPKMFLQECKYIIKEKKISNYTIDDVEKSDEEDSSEENSDKKDSDKEDSD